MQARDEKLVFKKIYSVVGEPVPEKDRYKNYLEKRAYRMTDRLIQTILTDPEFKDAFLKTTAVMATPAGR